MPTAIQRHYLSLLYFYVHIIQSIFMCAVQESNRAPYVRSGRHLLYLWNSLYSNIPVPCHLGRELHVQGLWSLAQRAGWGFLRPVLFPLPSRILRMRLLLPPLHVFRRRCTGTLPVILRLHDRCRRVALPLPRLLRQPILQHPPQLCRAGHNQRPSQRPPPLSSPQIAPRTPSGRQHQRH
jgi:hypothetical protein